jgi:P27 family predicted phage terminase small subunit
MQLDSFFNVSAIDISMGKGRKPLPQAAKNGIQSTSMPICPGYLDEIARTEWDFITSALKEMGVLQDTDRAGLELYCKAYSRAMRMHAVIQQEGEIVVSPNKYLQPHPAIAIMESAESTCTKWLIQFGLTPAARKKLEIKRQSDSAAKWKGLIR